MTVEFVVDQAGCASCAELVREVLSELGAVEAVEVDDSADLASVRLVADGAVSSEQLDALLAAGTEMTRHMKSPEELANGLAFLQIDLSDADFHALALENSRRIEAGYRALLDDAVKAGELQPCDTRHLARTVNAIAGGSLIAWAIHRKGSAESWVRADLNTLLTPYRARTARAADSQPRAHRATARKSKS